MLEELNDVLVEQGVNRFLGFLSTDRFQVFRQRFDVVAGTFSAEYVGKQDGADGHPADG